jgi:hypothetical protein
MPDLTYSEDDAPQQSQSEGCDDVGAALAKAARKRRAMPTYTQADAKDAPLGAIRIPDTDVGVVAYRINDTDLCLLVNKGQCIYRATLVGALDPNLVPHGSPLVSDTFVIRDLAGMRRLVDEMTGRVR